MGSLNKVLLIGNLGKDPELRYTPDGLAILRFSIATTEYFNDKSGSKNERTTWHNIVVFGKMGQSIANYLNKGKQVFIEGKINNRSYDDKEGNKKYITEIVATNIVLLGAKGGAGSGAEIAEEGGAAGGNNYAVQGGAGESGYGGAGSQDDDDIPF
ncbi:MAG: single-stranded DNA-binding protein [Deltaproteobacteria bacterium]|nr:single-stranded DNA-binding protein [Deltaproteobacteria bacterium]MCL5891791.1 single-stranded DNA-binding protein [Deltaproteobacteria bacterium]